MQNNYETIMIINSTMEEAAIKSTIEKIKDLISANGAVESVEEWGNKKLAYPVKKHSEGYYVLVNFSSNPEFIDELERVYNITDEVLKHIVIKKD
ncbi:MAG: 30S ribosomal protein S6 [Clostridia bacterium]|nr:30S ribosomal protein S6 [Clostridia bacterium]